MLIRLSPKPLNMNMKILEILTQGQPSVLYHVAPTSERQSVMQHGLLRSKSYAHALAADMGIATSDDPIGGIFFASKPIHQRNFDLWEVDVRGLHLEPDDTTDPEDPEDSWWVTYEDDIPPIRLRLIDAPYG